MKKVSLELGGNAPFIVFDDADLDAAVEGAIARSIATPGRPACAPTGSTCRRGVYDAFADEAVAPPWPTLRVGNGVEGRRDQVGPLIDERAVAKVEEHIADATAKGARVSPAARATRSAARSSSRRC